MFFGISAAIILLLFVFIMRRGSLIKRQEKTQTGKGLAVMQFMPKLIALCQQHRGISNAILQGSPDLQVQLLSIQKKVEQLISESKELELDVFDQWESFIEHWPKLKAHSLNSDLTSQNLIRQHNIMIDGHFSLLDDVASRYQLYAIMLDNSTRLAALCLDTLRVTETIAQARGIGSGVCAKGNCDGVEKISLNFLSISISTATDNLLSELNDIDNPALSNQFGTSSTAIKESVGKLLHTLDTQVLISGQTSITADNYFKTATNPINELLHVFSDSVSYALDQNSRK